MSRSNASTPSFKAKNVMIGASNAAYNLIRGPNSAAPVQARHRVGGDTAPATNYVDVILSPDLFPGFSGNGISITLTDGANRVRYRAGSNLVEIRHAANSLQGVKAAIDASDGSIITSSDITGQSANEPAAYTEHGTFTGGADRIYPEHRKVWITAENNWREVGFIIQASATAPAATVQPDFVASRHSFPLVIDVPGDLNLFGQMIIATGTEAARPCTVQEFTGLALVDFQPPMQTQVSQL